MAANTEILKGETHVDPSAPQMDIQKMLEAFLDSLLAEQQGERATAQEDRT